MDRNATQRINARNNGQMNINHETSSHPSNVCRLIGRIAHHTTSRQPESSAYNQDPSKAPAASMRISLDRVIVADAQQLLQNKEIIAKETLAQHAAISSLACCCIVDPYSLVRLGGTCQYEPSDLRRRPFVKEWASSVATSMI